MKTMQTFKLGLLTAGALALMASATQTLADQPGPYYAMPSWDQKLQCDTRATCPRFILLSNWNSEAVLDRETGLVWEKSPSTSTYTWDNAQASNHCNTITVGDRIGWRLPTIQELSSLVDKAPANTSDPRLPIGHPFTGVQTVYWSASSSLAFGSVNAWIVSFFGGGAGLAPKSSPTFVWCVRGGSGVDVQ